MQDSIQCLTLFLNRERMNIVKDMKYFGVNQKLCKSIKYNILFYIYISGTVY